MRFAVSLFTFLLSSIPIPESLAADRKLTGPVAATLQANCLSCHGDKDTAGGIDDIRDLEGLIKAGKVVPGKPKESPLFLRLSAKGSRRMPPPEDYDGKALKPLSAAEIEAIEKLIASLPSSDEKRASPAESKEPAGVVEYEAIQKTLLADLDALKRKGKTTKSIRYLTFTHLTAEKASKVSKAAGAWLNFLSWGKAIVVPEAVYPGEGKILRLDLADYGWSPSHWALLVSLHPYTLSPRSNLNEDLRENQKRLREATDEATPFVRGDWFLDATSRPPLYHHLLALPDTKAGLKALLGVEEHAPQLRAGFKRSQVAFHNRNVLVTEGRFGPYWETFDFDFRGKASETNLFERPLDQSFKSAAKNPDEIFSEAGGEIIFTLPNGLHGYYVMNRDGKRLDQAPFQVANHPRVPWPITLACRRR